MVNIVRNISSRFGKSAAHRFPELAPADAALEQDPTVFTLDEVDADLATDAPVYAKTNDAAPLGDAEDDSALLAAVLAKTGPAKTTRKTPASAAKPAPKQDAAPRRAQDWVLPGFEGKCRVATSFGDLPIEALRRRDLVKTISGAYREVQWVDAIRLDVDFLAQHEFAQPVLVRARSLGGGFPVRNMLVSPAQTLRMADPSGRFRTQKAIDMLGLPGVMRQHRSEFTYYRFHCGSSEQVCIEGSYFDVSPPV